MKNIFLYSLMLLSALSFSSCSDEDESFGDSLDREWMTMFICDNNRGKGDDYAYNCKAEGPNGNDIHLYWYGVNDCAGYQIRQALQPNVANGADAWGTSAENGLLLLDTIVGPDVLDLVIKDQQYSTDFRFAIRVLSKKDDNITDFSHASNGTDTATEDSGQNTLASLQPTVMLLRSVYMSTVQNYRNYDACHAEP